MKFLDKLKNKVKLDKNLFVFLIVLLLVGIIAGGVFVTILNNSDKTLVNEYINSFVDNIENGQVDYLFVIKNNLITNISYVLIIWLLGISIIGLPIIVIMYFFKIFTLGFTIGSIILSFKFKGVLFALIYAFPAQIFIILALLLLTMYAMSFSFKLIITIFKKKTMDFRLIMNKYFKILLICLIGVIIMSLYDAYVMPNIVKTIISFIR